MVAPLFGLDGMLEGIEPCRVDVVDRIDQSGHCRTRPCSQEPAQQLSRPGPLDDIAIDQRRVDEGAVLPITFDQTLVTQTVHDFGGRRIDQSFRDTNPVVEVTHRRTA